MFSASQKGVILLNTLLIMSLLSLLILSQMQMILLQCRLINNLVSRQQLFSVLEKEANLLAATNFEQIELDCLIKSNDPNQAIKLLKANKGCLLHHSTDNFTYLIEPLGTFPSLKIKWNGAVYDSAHWRLTIANLENSLFLQLRIAKTKPITVGENKPFSYISPGILSWRYLDAV